MNFLMLIDDQALRKSAFKETAKILKKIEKLEAAAEMFHAQELRLFENWRALTFQVEHQRLDDLGVAYNRLAEVHNQLIAILRYYECDLVEAWMRLERENKRLAKADQAGRQKILNQRETRQKLWDQDVEEASVDDDEPDAVDEFEFFLRAVRAMSEADLRAINREPGVAHQILWRVLAAADSEDDYVLAFRVWRFVAPKDQIEFDKIFRQKYDQPFLEYLKDMGPDNYDFGPRQKKSQGPPVQPAPIETPKPSSAETLKLLYRKLVRELHPDRGGGAAKVAHWHHSIWMRVQGAYQRQDLLDLKKLWALVLVRSGELSQMSMSEILASRDELRGEFDQLGRGLRAYKKSPAWGFSKRKSYAALEKKLRKPIAKELSRLEQVVQRLRSEHIDLARAANQRRAQKSSGRRRARSLNLFDQLDQLYSE